MSGEYWRGMVKHLEEQEKAWHEVALFCRGIREELAVKRAELKKRLVKL